MKSFNSTFEYKLIYVFRINDLEHKDLLKIGEATCNTNKAATELFPNCKELNTAAKNRINQYTTTAGIAYELLYTEIAVYDTIKNGVMQTKAFSDHDVHKVLERSGIKRHYFDTQNKANEWFKVDLETAKKAIQAVKEGRASLTSSEVTEGNSPIIFRPEQKRAIKETVAQFKKSDRMLWNAKMRFGKTLTALQVAKEMEFKRTIILTHRPVVSDGWYEDFGKIFYDTDYVFGSKTKGEKIENLAGTNKKFVYFASMQDLRGSDVVGGKFDKNEDIFLTEWDFVVIDEAHEGTLTKLGQAVIDTIKELSKSPKILRLSGTPFNLLEQFKSDEIYTWDYVMEQYAKKHWDDEHFGDSNPYASLPELQIFTYNLDKLIPGYMDLEDCAFNFREFFRTWTGNVEKDFKPIPDGAKIGDFVHKNDVLAFLNLLCKDDNNSNYPFATEEYRDFFRHSLWMLPGVKEAKAFSALLHEHPVFGSGAFKIVNVAGDGDEEVNSKDALQAVRDAFGDNPAETYSITLSCGRLTTGVSVPEWTAVFMLSGTFSTSAANYYEAKKGSALSKAEEKELIDYCKANPSYQGNSAILVLLYTGMRVGELASMRKEGDYIYCESEKIRLGRKQVIRKIPISPMLKRVLSMIDFDVAKTTKKSTVRDALKRVFPERHVHEFRYTFITRAKECGVNPEVVMLWAGHESDSDVKTSKVDRGYTTYSEEYLLGEVHKIEYDL